MATKLNIGAGDIELDGWTAIDRKNGSEAFPLSYDDASVDEVRAVHVLEHFGFEDVPKALAEWFRVLKPGCRLRVSVPSFDKILGERGSDRDWPLHLMGGQVDEDDFHKSVFTEASLREVMRKVGFIGIQQWESDGKDLSAHAVSLNLEGVKPVLGADEVSSVRICAVTSIPRVGFNDHWGTLFNALQKFRIPIRRATGAYWDQCLQNVLEDCVRDGFDWVLVVDYDTMFTYEDLNHLLVTFREHPDMDALAPLQCRRFSNSKLMTIDGRAVEVVESGWIKVDTAHFGLTLLRTDALRRMPKPWFQSHAAEDGTWRTKGKIDADIDFWNKWKAAGNTLYVDTDVRIGHLQLMVLEFDHNMDPVVSSIAEWWERVVPECERGNYGTD